MSGLMIRCSVTGAAIATGIEVEAADFQRLPDVLLRTYCPHCGLHHSWWRREAWLEDEAASTGAEPNPPSPH